MTASVTITDEHPQFSAVVALLSGASPAAMAATLPLPTPAPTTGTTGNMPGSPLATSAPMPGAPALDDTDDNGPANADAPAVDSNGLPWDERIHAKTKATTGDGAWRKRRGVDEATVAAVEADLKSRAATLAPAPIPQPVPVPMPMPAPIPAPVPNPQPVAAPMPTPMPAPVDTAQGAVAAAPVYSPPPMPAPVDQAPQPIPAPIPAPAPAPAPAPVAAAPIDQAGVVAATANATGTLDFAQFMLHLSSQMQKMDAAGAPLVHTDYLANVTAETARAFNTELKSITDISTNPQMITYVSQCLQRDSKW